MPQNKKIELEPEEYADFKKWQKEKEKIKLAFEEKAKYLEEEEKREILQEKLYDFGMDVGKKIAKAIKTVVVTTPIPITKGDVLFYSIEDGISDYFNANGWYMELITVKNPPKTKKVKKNVRNK